MRAFKFENSLVPVPVRDVGRFRPLGDAAWPPTARAYGGLVESPWRAGARVTLMALQLTVPVLLLFTLLAAVYLYADAALAAAMLPPLARQAGLTISDLILPGCWTILHLTNRRYGSGHAFCQLAAVLVLALLVGLVNPGDIDHWLPPLPALTLRAVLAFGGAFAIANFVAIIAFDAARGPCWWRAPLAASSAAALVFSGLYYPAAFGGEPRTMLVHVLLFLGEGAVLLIPYCLLRPAMRPLNGMNGF